MDNYDWQDSLIRRSKLDPWVAECQALVDAMTPGYLAILACLTPGQRETLSDYIAACEEREHSLTLLAYSLGKEHAVL